MVVVGVDGGGVAKMKAWQARRLNSPLLAASRVGIETLKTWREGGIWMLIGGSFTCSGVVIPGTGLVDIFQFDGLERSVLESLWL